LTGTLGHTVPVLFTAHSVPLRTVQSAVPPTEPLVAAVVQEGPDTYAIDAKRTATLVAAQLANDGLRDTDWHFAFQSQGISGGPWIGPTVEDTLTALRQAGHTTVIIHPIGFVCDHVEILYDIDIGFRKFGERIGLRIERPESLNESPILTRALADLAQSALARLAAPSAVALPIP
jgi:ferrochelatase